MFKDDVDRAKGPFAAVVVNCSTLKFSKLGEELDDVRIGDTKFQVADREFARRIAFWQGVDSVQGRLHHLHGSAIELNALKPLHG